MSLKRRLSLPVMLAATLLTVAAVSPANATTITAEGDLERIGAAVSGTAGDVTFNGAAALNLVREPAVVHEFAVGIVAGGGTVVGIDVDETAVEKLVALLRETSAACVGANVGTVEWYGWQLKIDSCKAAQLQASVAAGAGVAVVAGLLTSWTGVGGISAGAIASLLAVGAGFISVCAAPGKGLILNLAWTGLPWCASQ